MYSSRHKFLKKNSLPHCMGLDVVLRDDEIAVFVIYMTKCKCFITLSVITVAYHCMTVFKHNIQIQDSL